MDIAKIRKKAKAREKEQEAGETPAPSAGSEEKIGPEEQPGDLAPETVLAGDAETAAAVIGPEKLEAKPREPNVAAETPEEIQELLTFSLSTEEFAFRVPEVEEIIRFQRITWVPTLPDYVLG